MLFELNPIRPCNGNTLTQQASEASIILKNVLLNNEVESGPNRPESLMPSHRLTRPPIDLESAQIIH